MRPGLAARVARSVNSVGVRSTVLPATSVRIRGTSRTTSPARMTSPGADRAIGPAQDGLDPRDELARRERLGEVVVGAELEAEQLVELVVAGGEHHDRDRASRARSSRVTSRPSSPGRPRSSTTRSGCSRRAVSSAAGPSAAVSTAKPACSR